MLYAAPIWSSTCKTNIHKLQLIQNKCLRMITNSDYYTKIKDMQQKLKIQDITIDIFNLTYNFYNFQIKHLQESDDVGNYTHETAPFKIKHKLPHQILIKDKQKAQQTHN